MAAPRRAWGASPPPPSHDACAPLAPPPVGFSKKLKLKPTPVIIPFQNFKENFFEFKVPYFANFSLNFLYSLYDHLAKVNGCIIYLIYPEMRRLSLCPPRKWQLFITLPPMQKMLINQSINQRLISKNPKIILFLICLKYPEPSLQNLIHFFKILKIP